VMCLVFDGCVDAFGFLRDLFEISLFSVFCVVLCCVLCFSPFYSV
jgi:hypothetical protein